MTINELEQGIRNLIATQPVIMSGASGEVVSGVLSMIDAFRNLSFKTQAYPCQDALKYNMSNELQKLENNFSSMVCTVLQERGINILLYIPRSAGQVGTTVNQFGVVQPQIDQSMLMGQMMYSQVPQNMAMQNGQGYVQNNMMMQQPMMQQASYGQYQQAMPQSQPRVPQGGQFQGGYGNAQNKVKVPVPREQNIQNLQVRSAPQSKIQSAPKQSAAGARQNANYQEPQQQAAPQKQPEASTDEYVPSNSKSAGRDYLMELLKK